LRRYSLTKLCNGAQMAIFWVLLSSELRAARFSLSDLHSKVALGPHHV